MIELKNVEKKFGKRTLFKDVGITFEAKKIYGLIGPSGTGKTTLLNMIGMIDSDYKGNILIDGTDYSSLSKKNREKERIQHFSYVFAEPFFLDYLTIKENILLPIVLTKGKQVEDLDKLASLFELDIPLTNKPSSLSEGEAQRLSVIRALVGGQDIILADEPSSHLDPENSRRCLEALSQAAHVKGRIVIVTTHDYSLLPFFDASYSIKNESIVKAEEGKDVPLKK